MNKGQYFIHSMLRVLFLLFINKLSHYYWSKEYLNKTVVQWFNPIVVDFLTQLYDLLSNIFETLMCCIEILYYSYFSKMTHACGHV